MTRVAGFLNQMCINTKIRFSNFINDEKGDTNFLSIIIILVIIIGVAILFIGFKDEIMDLMNGKIDDLKKALG